MKMCSKFEILAAAIAALLTTTSVFITVTMMKSACDQRCNLVKEPQSLDQIAENLLLTLGIEPQDPTAKVDKESVKRFFFNTFPTFVNPNWDPHESGNEREFSESAKRDEENIDLQPF